MAVAKRGFIAMDLSSGEGRNFRIERDLDHHEDYYIKINAGGWPRDTGRYLLHIEENVDTIESYSGGTWISEGRYRSIRLASSGLYIEKIMFLSPERAVNFYHYLSKNVIIEAHDRYMQFGMDAVFAFIGFKVKGPAGIAVGHFISSQIVNNLIPSLLDINRAELFEAASGRYVLKNGFLQPEFRYGVVISFMEFHNRNFSRVWLRYERKVSSEMQGATLQRGEFIFHE